MIIYVYSPIQYLIEKEVDLHYSESSYENAIIENFVDTLGYKYAYGPLVVR